MYQIVVCPKHKKALVFYKDTDTHSLFKCPDCDYVCYPGVVHRDLPEKYMNLKAENKKLEKRNLKLLKELKNKVTALAKFHNKKWRFEEKIQDLKEDNEQLREKFIEFGQHDAGCLAKHKHGKCSCGFEQALKEK